MGSTSLAITTSWAFFFSTRVVTVLTPCLTTGALLLGASSLPSALAAALSLSLSFLACLVSGLYLSSSLKSWVAEQSKVSTENYLDSEHDYRHSLPSSAVIALYGAAGCQHETVMAIAGQELIVGPSLLRWSSWPSTTRPSWPLLCKQELIV